MRQSWSFIEAVLASPSVDVLTETHRHTAVLKTLANQSPGLSGNLLHDAHIAAVMTEHGIRVIYTRDRDFHRFSTLEVRDPLD